MLETQRSTRTVPSPPGHSSHLPGSIVFLQQRHLLGLHGCHKEQKTLVCLTQCLHYVGLACKILLLSGRCNRWIEHSVKKSNGFKKPKHFNKIGGIFTSQISIYSSLSEKAFSRKVWFHIHVQVATPTIENSQIKTFRTKLLKLINYILGFRICK